MSRTRQIYTQLFFLLPVLVIGNWIYANAAVAQTVPAELPADCSAYDAVPLPSEAARVPVPKTFPDCASYRSYRGIGRPVNYSEARACAWRERQAQIDGIGQEPWFVGGSLILADIYFNGAGVERNVPLAMRFACESDEGMAMLALKYISKDSNALPGLRPFEFCDYADTTITMNFCFSYALEIRDDRRSRYYRSLKSSMPTEQKAAFEKLLAAQSKYTETHALEVDQGGTIRGVRTMGSEDILNDLFHAEIVHFERKQWPVFSDRQIATADDLLHSEYEKTLQQLRSHTKEEIDEGAVTADHLSNVQGTWEKYRDAWVAFARLRYPTSVTTIRVKITLDRYRLLKTIN